MNETNATMPKKTVESLGPIEFHKTKPFRSGDQKVVLRHETGCQKATRSAGVPNLGEGYVCGRFGNATSASKEKATTTKQRR